jgi:hypothetical protein
MVELLLLLLLWLLLLLEACEIVGDGPNSTAIVVDAADPHVGYTPCGTSEEHH